MIIDNVLTTFVANIHNSKLFIHVFFNNIFTLFKLTIQQKLVIFSIIIITSSKYFCYPVQHLVSICCMFLFLPSHFRFCGYPHICRILATENTCTSNYLLTEIRNTHQVLSLFHNEKMIFFICSFSFVCMIVFCYYIFHIFRKKKKKKIQAIR